MPDVVGILTTVLAVTGGVLGIIWKLQAIQKHNESKLEQFVEWRTEVKMRMNRMDQWRSSVDANMERILDEIHRTQRRIDRAGINGH